MYDERLIRTLLGAAHMQRWNDHIKPVELTELDKQAHKMVLAWILGRLEQEQGAAFDWEALIEGGLFELLFRTELTDIKPRVFERLAASKGKELAAWALSRLEPELLRVASGAFTARFANYLFCEQKDTRERRVLRAAHYLATRYEFRIIQATAPCNFGIDETGKAIEAELARHLELASVQRLERDEALQGFASLCAQLRFQKRWAKTPRIPATSVLGHMLVVGALAYLAALEIEACPRRRVLLFFSGLFHDLPEALTRDIVSPVKRSVPGLEQLVKECEEEEVQSQLLPLLPGPWHNDLLYLIEDEFEDRAVENGEKKLLQEGELHRLYNEDRYNPVDGALIEIIDKLSALAEASLSMEHGITSRSLAAAREKLKIDYAGRKWLGQDFGGLFEAF